MSAKTTRTTIVHRSEDMQHFSSVLPFVPISYKDSAAVLGQLLKNHSVDGQQAGRRKLQYIQMYPRAALASRWAP